MKMEFDALRNASQCCPQNRRCPKINPSLSINMVSETGIVGYLKQWGLEQGQELFPVSPTGHRTGSGAVSGVVSGQSDPQDLAPVLERSIAFDLLDRNLCYCPREWHCHP